MGFLGRVVFGILIAAVLSVAAAGAALWLALDAAPQVPPPTQAALLDLARAVRLLGNIDPRLQGSDGPRELRLSPQELELLIGQAAQRTALPLAARVTLQAQLAQLQISLAVNSGLLPEALKAWIGHNAWLDQRWLNLDVGLRQTASLPQIERLRLGRLPLPAWVGEWALQRQLEQRLGAEQVLRARDMVQIVAFSADAIQVNYVWQSGQLRRMMAVLVPERDQQRLRLYLERLSTLKLKSIAGGRIPMVQLLPSVFGLAQQQTAAGADAVQENRAALLALAFASFPRELANVLPAAHTWRLPRPWPLTLAAREDFPLHYLISAALAVEAGGPFADAVGVFKEVLDARGSSGFSFNDIAADRAGTRLGLLARRDPQRLQATLASALTDTDLLPDIRDVPESLTTAEFTTRYGAIGSPAYQALLNDIEARLDKLPLYR